MTRLAPYIVILVMASCGDCTSKEYESCENNAAGGSQTCESYPPALVVDEPVTLDARGNATISGVNAGKGELLIQKIESTSDNLILEDMKLPLTLAPDEMFMVNVSGTGGGEILIHTNDPQFTNGVARVPVVQ